MYALAILAGVIVAGVLVGALRNRRNSAHELPSPFRRPPQS